MDTTVMWEITLNVLTVALTFGLVLLMVIVFMGVICGILKSAIREEHTAIMEEIRTITSPGMRGQDEGRGTEA